MTPGTRPTLNSAMTGTRYTKAGMVCIASSSGLSALRTWSLRADQMPTGTAMTTASTTATITWLRVSIAMSQIPSAPMANRHRKHVTGRRRRWETLQASSAVPPASIHQGSWVSR